MNIKAIITLFIAVAVISFQSKAQLTFSLGTGLQQNTATFGYKIKKFEPQLSVNLLHVSANYTESGLKNEPTSGAIINYEDKLKLTGTIYMPSVGVKYTFLEDEKLKAYGVASFTKIFVRAKATDNNDPNINDDLQKELKKVKLFGGRIGFGTEYFFDEQFSVGGEFGMMLLKVNFKNDFVDEIENPNTGDYMPTTITQTAKFGISPTYGKVSVNFYFGKK